MASGLAIVLPAIVLLTACGAKPGEDAAAPNHAAASAAAEPGPVETAAPALPTDAQIANAIDGHIQRTVYSPPPRVIVEPDGLRTVVRNARCTPLPAGGSRTRCSYETARAPMRFEDHAEAVEWLSGSSTWRRETRTFAYTRQTIAGRTSEGWRVP